MDMQTKEWGGYYVKLADVLTQILERNNEKMKQCLTEQVNRKLPNVLVKGGGIQYGTFCYSNFSFEKKCGTIELSDSGRIMLLGGRVYSIYVNARGRVTNTAYVLINLENNFGDIIDIIYCLSVANLKHYFVPNSDYIIYEPKEDCEIFLRCTSEHTFEDSPTGTVTIKEMITTYEGTEYETLFDGRLRNTGETATLKDNVMKYKYIVVADETVQGVSQTFIPNVNGNYVLLNASANQADRRIGLMILNDTITVSYGSRDASQAVVNKVYGFY